MDTTGAHGGVNNNLYLVFPDKSFFKGGANDCDAQHSGKPYCQEMDIVEMNGDCLAQTTWHVYEGHGGGCDQNGCWEQTHRSGTSHFHVTFGSSYFMDVYIDGKKVNIAHPNPSAK